MSGYKKQCFIAFFLGMCNCVVLSASATDIVAGNYWPGGGNVDTTCPAGYYCPGVANAEINANDDQGKIACSTVGNGSYVNSLAGATSADDCYKPCSTTDVSHSATVSGNVYSNGTNTCAAETCASGYRVKAGNPLLNVGDVVMSRGRFLYSDQSVGITLHAFLYGSVGQYRVRGICSTIPGTDDNGTWINPTMFDNLTDETGQTGASNCYCSIDGYAPNASAQTSVWTWDNLSSASVFWYDYANTNNGNNPESVCMQSCSNTCYERLMNPVYNSVRLNFRDVVFNSIGSSQYATCEQSSITINAGEYLAAGRRDVATCPAGYYCPGGIEAQYGANNDQGKISCSTVGNGSYVNSLAGATSADDCYKPCSTTDVSHSATVSGNVYSNGTNTCAAETCASGYRVKAGNMLLDIGDVSGSGSGISNEFWVEYGGKGTIHGHGICSTISGDNNNQTWTNPTMFGNLTDETGESGAVYCYCNVDGYLSQARFDAEISEFDSVSSSWVYWINYNVQNYTENDCANYCNNIVCPAALADDRSLNFRHAVFNSAGSSRYATCERSSITINAGEYLAAGDTSGTTCPENHWCPGGNFALSNQDVGIYACSDGMIAPLGTTNEGDCGRVLHVGQDTLYLTQERRTLPALAVRLDNKVYYGKTAPVSGGVKPMNTDTTNQLRLRLDGVEYSIY